ncbi:MAG: CoA-binding protein, partial [Candidatus Tectomicrobia bacterium]|nr:CoA-binding protein [Candidatus Tectomicrobia bacterium]
MSYDRAAVRAVLDQVRAEGRTALTAPEGKQVCEAYGIAVPQEGLATSAVEAARLAQEIGYPVVLKIVSTDILHKTDAGGVLTGLSSAAEVEQGYTRILSNARAYNADARILGVQVQQMLPAAQEVIIGATTDPSFGKLVAFGLGGVLVEVMQDITFRLAPANHDEAVSMLDDIAGAAVLKGVRGAAGVDREALGSLIEHVSQLVHDFPEISEMDLNPVFASPTSATAVDVRVVLDFAPAPQRYRPSQTDILQAMRRIMQPDAVAVIGATPEDGKIGNSVMKNLINGGYQGAIYPIHPRAESILGRQCYKSVLEVPGNVDIAIFCIPARFVAQVLAEVGQKNIPGAILIPSGFAEVGEEALQQEVVQVAREYNVRLMGPNIYGFYYTHKNLCATFCTPYDEKGQV